MKGILKGVFIILVILGLVRTFENYAIIDDVSNYYHENFAEKINQFQHHSKQTESLSLSDFF